MRRLCLVLVVFAFCGPLATAQQTIYFKKDHIYSSPGGGRVATVTPQPLDQTAPGAPTGLSQSNLTATSVQLSWTASTDSGGSGLAGYKIYRGNLPVATATGTSFIDQHLQAGTAYTYTVRAFDNDQNHSAPSTAVNITTSGGSTDTTAPSVPSGIDALLTAFASVRITWVPSVDTGGSGLAGYYILRDGLIVSGGTPVAVSTYDDTNPNFGTTYSYTVKAVDNNGNESLPSAAAIVTTSAFETLANPTAFWELEETSGTRFNSVLTGNNLTDNNTVGSMAGKVGNAAQFTLANTEYLSAADNPALSTGDIDFSIAAWVYFDSLTDARTIVSKADTGANEYLLYFYNNRIRFNVANAVEVAADNLGAPTTGQWYFVVAWHDSVNNQIGIQVNGGTADTAAYAGGVVDGTAPFVIGAYASSANAHDGRIDQVGFWKGVMSDEESMWLYNNGSGRMYSEITGGGE